MEFNWDLASTMHEPFIRITSLLFLNQ
jgi:hypothetical protein